MASFSTPLEQLAALHKALADQLRLQILRLLMHESFGVLELCRILEIRQSALSHHLKILANAQLVSTRREGNSIFYRRAFLTESDPLRELKAAVFAQVDALPIDQGQERKIRQLQLERSQLSLNFFNRNANKFLEKQGLIVAHGEYSNVLLDVIDNFGLGEDATVLEVGPGEGYLLVELADRFAKLIGLDNSLDMLERSQAAVAEAGHTQVQLIHGDTSVALGKNISSDLIIFEMVMHHISSPARTFQDCAALLKPGGHLLIVELAPHDQEWVREACGDLWLGIDKQDLDRWALDAGLIIDQGSYLQLRNGFQIQIRVFKRGTLDA
ncbi:MAG: metalloregulator ArsR/SmtB family transcription factor [Pseudohongiellaceae bacterium]